MFIKHFIDLLMYMWFYLHLKLFIMYKKKKKFLLYSDQLEANI